MAVSQKALNDALREKWVKLTKEWLESIDEEAIKYKTNEICIPTVDEAGNDKYVQFVIKIPKGSRDGEEFDGYSMREEYEIKLKEKAEKEKKTAEAKAKKIERDKKTREKKAKEKEE